MSFLNVFDATIPWDDVVNTINGIELVQQNSFGNQYFDNEYFDNESLWNPPLCVAIGISQMYDNESIILEVTNNIYRVMSKSTILGLQHIMKITDYSLYLAILKHIGTHINFVRVRIGETEKRTHFVIYYVIKSMCAHYYFENKKMSSFLVSVL